MQSPRTTIRHRSRAVARRRRASSWPPPPACWRRPRPAPHPAPPPRPASWSARPPQQLTVIDEQVHEAELIVADQQQAATAAAAAGRRRPDGARPPTSRGCARSPQSGYTGKTQSRVAAFLTSESAERARPADDDAGHDRRAHQRRRLRGRRGAGRRASRPRPPRTRRQPTPTAGLEQLEAQQAEVKKQVAAYQADFARLSAAEQAVVTTAVAGPAHPAAPEPAAAARRRGRGHRDRAGPGRRPVPARGASARTPSTAPASRPTPTPRPASRCRTPAARSRSWAPRSRARELQPGDLVFFYTPISHVGLYIGNGMMVHARTYGSPVAVTSVDQRGFRSASVRSSR